MSDEALIVLANKFSTTVEHLWGVLIVQGYLGLVTDGVLALILTGGFIFLRKKLEGVKSSLSKMDREMSVVVYYVFFALLIIFWIVYFHDFITVMFNPEYGAIQTLLKLKG
jgi:hypothetical protein